ncbi:hypothetical protein [Frigoriflavimonas asaccharolytica]|uniref:Uncharacterized protein n=1 Tax=Frigoriflavimonas asaccharolytica TaxID=2735899 RepID=A0A8J8G9Q9_9FLAO|nr:hypothetical protein [Frigoriflavimonas asaccharolytica]NRS94078.1 hypothetical protein [Frigoriflavimonas asaccharolytica]
MFKKLFTLIFSILLITINAQKLTICSKYKNDLYEIFNGKYQKDLCTTTNDFGFAVCELYTLQISEKYIILNIDGQNIEKELKLFSTKINKNSYQIFDENFNKIGMIYIVKNTFYFNYKYYLKNADEKKINIGYKFNKIE